MANWKKVQDGATKGRASKKRDHKLVRRGKKVVRASDRGVGGAE